jgi:ribonuclease PH
MRSIVDMKALGENTIVIDCDVLQADGGTRCASITGAYVALALGLKTAVANGLLATADNVLIDSVSAVSVGIIDSEVRLDLHYDDDVAADVDMNVVMTGTGGLVEVQGTAEGRTFSRDTLNHMMDLATVGCIDLSKLQAAALK